MLDFFEIETKNSRNGLTVLPNFKIKGTVKDIMVQGKDFYAVWNEKTGLWSRNEYDVQMVIDDAIDDFIESKKLGNNLIPLYMCDYSSGIWKKYKDYIRNIPTNYHQLDTKIVFANDPVKKSDYVSRRLPYEMKRGKMTAYNELMSVLYEPNERKKLEWAIGAIISGDSKKIQKFIAITGEPGKGKGTFLNILASMFDGYVSMFNAKELANGNNAFAGDAFANNPLIAIQTDGDLSRIQDNTLLNSIISHEKIIINEKFKSKYEIKLNSFLFMATNGDIAITEYNSGLKRRLIDVKPSNKTVDPVRYDELMEEIENEKGAIAYHCLKLYEKMGKDAYKNYESKEQESRTNIMYNFVETELLLDPILKDKGYITAKRAYNLYKNYCEDSGFKGRLPLMKFKIELKHYFREFKDQCITPSGSRERSCYFGLKTEEFDVNRFVTEDRPVDKVPNWLKFKEQDSLLDNVLSECPAQYSKLNKKLGLYTPEVPWKTCKTKLKDIDTTEEHYTKMPENMIVLDFDITNEQGEKDRELNIKEASNWPKTYGEYSKSGSGIHLHYYYDGDITLLANDLRKEGCNIDIKKQVGDASLRRKLTMCNNVSIAHLKEGDLPLKEKKKVYSEQGFKNEQSLRNFIMSCMRKEHHGATKPEVDYIKAKLDEAYESGMVYDVTNLKPYIVTFAQDSTNKAGICLNTVAKMKFKSKDLEDTPEYVDIPFDDNKPLVFFDIEVFPNLLLICWKIAGKGNPFVDMINPTPDEIRYLYSNYRLVGYNNRRYDNHIIYGASLGLSNIDIYHLSKKLITGNAVDVGYREAWNLSYTDIWDYLPAPKKQKLKKWEIDLGIHHQELGYDWDQPVPEKLWPNVIKYCHFDVDATEATWDATQGDFLARQILAELTGLTVNTSTNKLTQRLLFGDDKNPVNEFRYRNLAEPVYDMDEEMKEFLTDLFPEMMAKPHGPAKSLLPYFPSYKTEWKTLVDAEGKKKKKLISSYRDVENVGEGGRVWAKPGMYPNVWTFDVTSMHPHSIMAEYLFGIFTRVFRELVYARVYIKHGEIDRCRELFDGRLIPFLDDPVKLEALPDAFKTAINAVYGQTKATFECILKDPRNKDNIVAKRGALFMIDLHHALEDMGAEVIHIKTDSIKVVNPTEEVKQFIIDFGKRYGYSFEVEHIFEKICLVNDAVYIAKMDKADEGWIKACKKAKAKGEPEPTRWTATGTEFAVPYVFKTLFSHENIEFKDLCEVKSSKNNIYLDFDETLKDVSFYEHCKDTRDKINRNIKTTKKAVSELDEISGMTDEELDAKIAEGHDYRFVGAIGLFCPVREGTAGAKMVTPNNVGKWSAPSGTKDYRWKEAEIVDANGLQDTIDVGYFEDLVTDAIKDISKFGDFESFAA